MIIGGLGSDKINVLLNSIKHQRPDINKIYHVKYQFESKYQLLIKEREKVGIKQTKIPKKIIYYSQKIDAVYENLEHSNPTKKKTIY